MTRTAALLERAREGTCRLIVCKRDSCTQVLAREGARGDVYPVVVGAYIDQDARLVVTCPACGERNRLPTRRVA